MSDAWQPLLAAARELVAILPTDTLAALQQRIATVDIAREKSAVADVLDVVASGPAREATWALLHAWRRDAPELPASAIALALASTRGMDDAWRARQGGEAVWSGPTPEGSSLRGVEEALLAVIRGAGAHLTLVSFAAGKVPEIAAALREAAQRGVALRIIMESPETREGALAFREFEALASALAANCIWYTWPLSKRPRDAQGRVGTIQATCALADRKVAFVASANLNDRPLVPSMAAGLTIAYGEVPGAFDDLIDGLIAERVLVRFRAER